MKQYIYIVLSVLLSFLELRIVWRTFINRKKHSYFAKGFFWLILFGLIELIFVNKITFLSKYLILFSSIFFTFLFYIEFLIMSFQFYIEMVAFKDEDKLFRQFTKKIKPTLKILLILIILLLYPHIIFSIFYIPFLVNKHLGNNPWNLIYLSFATYFYMPITLSMKDTNLFLQMIRSLHIVIGRLNELIVLGLFIAKIQKYLLPKDNSAADEISKLKSLCGKKIITSQEFEKAKENLLKSYEK